MRKKLSFRILTILVAVVLTPNPRITAQTTFAYEDRLQADATVATYRTGSMDEKVNTVPENIKKGLSTDPATGIPLLVNYLKSESNDDFQTIKRFHDWITFNIAYDNDAVSGISANIHNPTEVLKAKRATCDGFAALMKEMCTQAKLECAEVNGISRSLYNEKKKDMNAHVWNAVKIRNNWYLVDATHDSRMSYTNSQFSAKSNYRDTQLFLSALAKTTENLPLDSKYQYTGNPVSREDFLRKPIVNMLYFKLGLQFVTDVQSLITKERVPDKSANHSVVTDKMYVKKNIITIEMNVPKNVRVYAKMTDKDGKPMDANAFEWREGTKVFCLFSAPATGEYNAYISGCFDEKGKLPDKIYSFKLCGTDGAGPALPVPNNFYLNNAANSYGVKITKQNFNAAGEMSIELEHPATISLFAGIYEEGDNNVKVKGTAVTVKTENGITTTLCKIPAYAAKKFYLKVKAKPSSDKLFSDVIGSIKIER